MRMRLAIAVMFLAVTLASFASGGGVGVPDLLVERDGTTLWVATERALDEKGRFRSDVLAPHERSLKRSAALNMRRVAEEKARSPRSATTPVDECQTFRGSIPQHFVANQSFGDLVGNAEVIVSGRIRGMGDGFLFGLPGQLLELAPAYLKGAPAGGSTFLFYPLARIRTEAGLLCSKPVAAYVPPKTGDVVLVFSMVKPTVVEGHTILHVNLARELAHAPSGGDPVIPATLNAESGGSDDYPTLLRRVDDGVKQRSNRH